MGYGGKSKLSPNAIYTIVSKNYHNIKELLGIKSRLPTIKEKVYNGNYYLNCYLLYLSNILYFIRISIYLTYLY